MVSVLPASVPSGRNAACSVTVISRPPSRAVEPGDKPDPPVPSVMAMMPAVLLAAIATRHMAGCTW